MSSFFNLSAEPLSFGPRLYLLISLWNEKTHVCWVWSLAIDVPSFHYAVTHVCNKNSNIQERSPTRNVVKMSFHTIRNCS